MDNQPAYCPVCNQSVLAYRRGVNHVLHAILSLLTVGLWLFVWLLCVLIRAPWQCSRCNSRYVQVGFQGRH